MRFERLTCEQGGLTRKIVCLFAEAFGEQVETLTDQYIERLLSRTDFLAIAAIDGDDDVVGGLTAYLLPLTRAQLSELFIYDLAVREGHRRSGVGFGLISAALKIAGPAIEAAFVDADNRDVDALQFYKSIGGRAMPVTQFSFVTDHADQQSMTASPLRK